MKVHVITIGCEGLMTEYNPAVFDNEEQAGQYFQANIVEKGFRQKSENETWDDYAKEFHSWENSESCSYDIMDWEIHWFQDIAINVKYIWRGLCCACGKA